MIVTDNHIVPVIGGDLRTTDLAVGDGILYDLDCCAQKGGIEIDSGGRLYSMIKSIEPVDIDDKGAWLLQQHRRVGA